MACLAATLLLLGLNVVGLAVAVGDKRRARSGRRRVPERALLLLALGGAWPGLLLAFIAVRHKTRKARFLVPFALTAILGTLGWLAALDLAGCIDLPALADS